MARGRPRKIDPEVALEKAMKLFWEKGYEGTSMSDLVEATGMAKPGLYATFGDKEELYLKSLDHYFESAGRKLYNDLADSDVPVRDALLAFYETIINSMHQDDGPRGCLMVNTLIESAHKDEKLNALAQSINDQRNNAFTKRFEKAKNAGEIPGDTEIETLTDFFSGQTLAIGVMGRAYASKEAMHRLVQTAMKTLPLAN